MMRRSLRNILARQHLDAYCWPARSADMRRELEGADWTLDILDCLSVLDLGVRKCAHEWPPA